MTALWVVQARMGSTRLPGKVIADVAGKPMLAFMLERLTAGLTAGDRLVVATSDGGRDDAVADVAARSGADVVRGSEADVLSRFALALERWPSAHVVRLTADCPLADPGVVRDALARARESDADYVSNTLVRTFPDGLDVEVLRAGALRSAVDEARDPDEREHVTPFVYRRPGRFRLDALRSGEALGDERWTVDTEADLAAIRAMVDRLDDPVAAGWRDILAAVGRRHRYREGDLRLEPSARSTPAARRWDCRLGDELVATIGVDVDDGMGRVRFDGPDEWRERALDRLRAALLADKQVTELVEPQTPD